MTTKGSHDLIAFLFTKNIVFCNESAENPTLSLKVFQLSCYQLFGVWLVKSFSVGEDHEPLTIVREVEELDLKRDFMDKEHDKGDAMAKAAYFRI